MPIPCLSCRQMMSAAAIICPHCGDRQADRDWQSVDEPSPPAAQPLHVSNEEAAALITVRGAGALDTEPATGPLSLVLPRPEATGWVRIAEWSLTALAVPVLVPGFVFSLFRIRLLSVALMKAGEVWLTLLFGALGGTSLLSVCGAAGWSEASALGLVGVCLGALAARLALRKRLRP